MYVFDRSTPVTVSLRLHRGTAEVVAEERPDAQVEVVAENGGEAVEDFTVTLEGDTLVVHAPEWTWNWRRTPKVRVRIRVPLDSALAAKSASADIRATGRWASAQADVASADVSLDEVTGDAFLKAASGDLAAGRVGGSLRISSSSGGLRVGDVNGDVNADTASGDITLRRVGGSLHARTASGEVEVGLLSRGKARVSTASGDVSVGVAAGTGVWLDLDTASGSTSSDLAMRGGAPAGTPEAALELRVRTASGDIDVHRATGDLRAAA
ncbi:DUF4097 family beta strand repeat-containing protein [Amorphoplanes nipponensis]|uniref:DUF4097 domain-containing protein n=1 Tax=Actinoplanes nipponensis TaxID=135950 RepID=A0A919JQR1_9ACTN|nr:DUF4097 family beta strand repeat-containing protein [Actinoplanes nipponensis]GIE51219.1 hypothetical protein Ani05nite_47530 [Actinoplanes nipponensis]